MIEIIILHVVILLLIILIALSWPYKVEPYFYGYPAKYSTEESGYIPKKY